jgi:hypothetical protein
MKGGDLSAWDNANSQPCIRGIMRSFVGILAPWNPDRSPQGKKKCAKTMGLRVIRALRSRASISLAKTKRHPLFRSLEQRIPNYVINQLRDA